MSRTLFALVSLTSFVFTASAGAGCIDNYKDGKPNILRSTGKGAGMGLAVGAVGGAGICAQGGEKVDRFFLECTGKAAAGGLVVGAVVGATVGTVKKLTDKRKNLDKVLAEAIKGDGKQLRKFTEYTQNLAGKAGKSISADQVRERLVDGDGKDAFCTGTLYTREEVAVAIITPSSPPSSDTASLPIDLIERTKRLAVETRALESNKAFERNEMEELVATTRAMAEKTEAVARSLENKQNAAMEEMNEQLKRISEQTRLMRLKINLPEEPSGSK